MNDGHEERLTDIHEAGQQMFDTSVYRSRETIEEFHKMINNLYEVAQNTKPTPFHDLLESLAKSDRLLRLYTQNVDFLDTRYQNLSTVVPVPPTGPWPKVIAVHGSLAKMTCTKCQVIKDFNPELFRIWKEDTPECNDCKRGDNARVAAGRRPLGVGFIRPRMVLYGEPGYDAINIGSCMASDLRNRPDALIVVGTTLKIPGTKTMVKEMSKAIGNRGHIIWLNMDDAPGGEFDDVWDFVIKGDCQKVAELMQGIPIFHKDQSFVADMPLSASQETQKDSEMVASLNSRNEYWKVINGPCDSLKNGLLTPAASLPSYSDDEKSNKPMQAPELLTNVHQPNRKLVPSTVLVPQMTNTACFYAPLRNTKVNSLKRKRPSKPKADVKVKQVKSTTPHEQKQIPPKSVVKRPRPKAQPHARAKSVKSTGIITPQPSFIVKLKISPKSREKSDKDNVQHRVEAGTSHEAKEYLEAPDLVQFPVQGQPRSCSDDDTSTGLSADQMTVQDTRVRTPSTEVSLDDTILTTTSTTLLAPPPPQTVSATDVATRTAMIESIYAVGTSQIAISKDGIILVPFSRDVIHGDSTVSEALASQTISDSPSTPTLMSPTVTTMTTTTMTTMNPPTRDPCRKVHKWSHVQPSRRSLRLSVSTSSS